MISVRNFMRDYFEPRLLKKVMQDGVQFKPIADYSLLNRASPLVRIKPVHFVPSSRGSDPRAAFVTVETQAVQGFVSVSGVVAKYSTRPYDLRLFRNGQLVGQWPGDLPGRSASWRNRSRIPLRPGQTKAEHTFRVALHSKDRGKPVVFTAYAFN